MTEHVLSPYHDLTAKMENALPGDIIALRAGTHRLSKALEWPNPGVTIKAFGSERAAVDLGQYNLTVKGEGVTLKDVAFFSSDPLRRSALTGSAPADILRGSLDFRGLNFKALGCMFYDLKGLGWWADSWGDMLGCLSQNHGWWGAGDRGHGHALYCQNNGIDYKRVTGGVLLKGYGDNLQFYGTSAANFKKLRLTDTVHVGGGVRIGGEAGSLVEDVEINRMRTWDASLSLGYKAAIDASVKLLDSTIHDDYQYGALSVRKWTALEIQLTKVIGMGSMASVGWIPQTAPVPGVVWDNNPYYNPNTLTMFGVDGEGFKTLADWRTRTGFDANSTFTQGLPLANEIHVTPLAAGRRIGLVTLYNWQRWPIVYVDLTPLNLTIGKLYRLHQVQDVEADRRLFQYTGMPLAVVMDGSQRAPIGEHMPITPNTFPDFGAFFVEAA